MQHGDLTHMEIRADDLDRAKRFYGELFGWTFQAVPGFDTYHMFVTSAGEEAMGGAIGKRGASAPDRMRTYVNVESIDATVSKVADLGGRVTDEKQEVPGMGWFAVLEDSEGNEIAIWETAGRG
jgi:uncharacterized protein